MSIGQLCNRTVIVTTPDTSIADAAKLMREHHVGDLVVVDEEQRPVALVTDRDIVVCVVALGLDAEAVTVADVSRRSVETIREDADFLDTLTHMRRCAVRRMPIVDSAGVLQGILTLDDALELIGEAVNNLVVLVSREVGLEEEHAVSTA
jgi:predicted transcriptional regulator